MRPVLSFSFAIALALGAAGWLHAQSPEATATPTFTGKGKVTEAVNTDTGAIFDVGSGVTMAFPRGLPVGRSRIVTLQVAKTSLPAKLIAGFKPLGPTLAFNGALGTADKPIVLSWATPRAPAVANRKLVVAMEVGTFCEGANKAFSVPGGLCSGFDLVDARYDTASKRLMAELRSTGGLRMQFGSVPAAAP